MHASSSLRSVPTPAYGVFASPNKRRYQEDAFAIASDLTGKDQVSVYAVFDGHGSSVVSQLASKQIPSQLRKILRKGDSSGPHLLAASKRAFRRTDKLLSGNSSAAKAGSTAVCALVTPDNIVTANCGEFPVSCW